MITFDPDALRTRIAELDESISAPGFWDDARAAGKVSAERAKLARELDLFDRLSGELDDLPTMVELAEEDEEMAAELATSVQRVRGEIDALQEAALFTGEYDGGPAIVQITPGAGGTDAQDWAEMLLRMYLRWCRAPRLQGRTIDRRSSRARRPASRAPRSRSSGDYAYGYLKAENGRPPAGAHLARSTANARRQTSFAAVTRAPEIDDEIEIDINEKDLRIDTYRSSGAGGQHVNKTDSAVRITHLPTGIVVAVPERAQPASGTARSAMKILRARLYELELSKRREKPSRRRPRKKDIAFGSQIRSYVLHPYRMVKDHRTEHETGNIRRACWTATSTRSSARSCSPARPVPMPTPSPRLQDVPAPLL